MNNVINDSGLDVLFRDGRSMNAWQDKALSDVTLQALYDLTRMGPTSANTSPARFVFIRTPEGRERLRPHLSEGNTLKTMTAPVTVIVAYDLDFAANLPQLFPHDPTARTWFEGDDDKVFETAMRNGTLQGGYLIMAARALGLDCGPMSGFDNAGVDREFFPNGRIKSNFLCNLGYGDRSEMPPRNPRLAFDQAAQIL
jgi:3-hydroxypropanoate dehydrogenase